MGIIEYLAKNNLPKEQAAYSAYMDQSSKIITKRMDAMEYLKTKIDTLETYDVIIVEFLVSTIDHYIGYDVIDNNTGTLYFPYYSNDNIHNLVEQKITKRIEEIFDELNNQNIITI